jgi:hypothetical protein
VKATVLTIVFVACGGLPSNAIANSYPTNSSDESDSEHAAVIDRTRLRSSAETASKKIDRRTKFSLNAAGGG